MYKYHLRKWGIQKNLRAKQARELLQQTRQGDRQASEYSIGGIRVDQERLRNLLKRASKSRRGAAAAAGPTGALGTPGELPVGAAVTLAGTESTASSSPSPLPTARLRPPHPQPQLEQMLHALRAYVSGSFGAGRWTRSHVPWQDGLVVAAHNCAWSAGRLMNSGHVAPAFRLLGICMDSCKNLLASDTPYFPVGIYAVLFEFSKRHEVLTKAVLAFLRDLALVLYRSRRHPMFILFQAMHQMTSEQLCQCAWAVSRSYREAFLGELGHDSASEAQMTALSGRGTSWVAAYGSADDYNLEISLNEHLEEVSKGDMTSFEALEAKLRIANFMLDRNRYDEARELAEEVQSQAESNGPEAQDAYLLDDCYRILFWLSRREGTREEATNAAKRWVDMCTTRLGRWHELTVDALGEVVEYHGDIGNVEEATRLRSEHDSAMNGMCERLERLGLGYEGATPQRRTMLYGRTSQQA